MRKRQYLCIVVQENVPKHSAKLCKEFLCHNEAIRKLEITVWLPQFHDLASIEHLWDELDRRAKPMQLCEYL